MIDPFLLTAPILLLGVAALLRFVGCHFTPGYAGPSVPTLNPAAVADTSVALSWTESDSSTGYSYAINRSQDGGAFAVINTVMDPTLTYTDTAVTNGTTYAYSITVNAYMENQTSNTIHATPCIVPGRPPGSTFNPGSAQAANLIGLFLMNEGTETAQGQPATDINLVDSVTATPNGAQPPTWVVADPSIQFNGGASLNSYLDAGVDPTFVDMPTSQISIVAKVFVPAYADGGFCEKNDGKPPNSDSGFIFALTNTGAIHIKVECSTQSMVLETNPNAVPTNQWIQVAFTWDGTQYNPGTQTAPNSACAIFINTVNQSGNINGANSHNGTGTLDTTKLSNNASFRIGNVGYDFAGSFNGKIAYMAVYKGRILAAADLTALDTMLPIQSPS
jgi:hypothetical protein